MGATNAGINIFAGIPPLIDPPTTGQVFFVGNSTTVVPGGTTGVDAAGAYGDSPKKPFATLDYALGASTGITAGRGDTIYVLPGHAETYSAAAALVCDVAGVNIIGLGSGNNRPTFTFATEVLTDIDIDAANVKIQGLRFIGNIAALAAPIDVNAAGFTMRYCDWYCAGATTDINMTVITDANADDMVIEFCNFNYIASRAATAATVTNTMTEVIRLVGADRANINNCFMNGNFTTACINGVTTASRDIQIFNNRLHNVQTTNIAGIIDLVASCDGIISYNSGFHGFVTNIATVIDPAGCAMIENYFSNVVTESGGIVGTRST